MPAELRRADAPCRSTVDERLQFNPTFTMSDLLKWLRPFFRRVGVFYPAQVLGLPRTTSAAALSGRRDSSSALSQGWPPGGYGAEVPKGMSVIGLASSILEFPSMAGSMNRRAAAHGFAAQRAREAESVRHAAAHPTTVREVAVRGRPAATQ